MTLMPVSGMPGRTGSRSVQARFLTWPILMAARLCSDIHHVYIIGRA